MRHLCRSTCQRKTGQPCQSGRTSGGARVVQLDDCGKPVKPDGKHPHATPHEKGAAVDLYIDGLSCRRIAENMDQYFGQETGSTGVYRRVRESTEMADSVVKPMKVATGGIWVADEVVVSVGGKKYWLFNVLDSDTRFMLAAYLSPTRTTRAAATALAMARQRAENPPRRVKTDGLRSYRDAMPRAFPTHPMKHVVSQGIKAEAAGAELPFKDWQDVAAMKSN